MDLGCPLALRDMIRDRVCSKLVIIGYDTGGVSMKDPIRWHFLGPLEESIGQSSDPFLLQLLSWVNDEDHRPEAVFRFQDLERQCALTNYTPADLRSTFYLGGQMLYKFDRFDDALKAFEHAEALRDPADKIDEIVLLRYRDLAAHRAHEFERSNDYSARLIELWVKAPVSLREDCLVEDGDAFLCNLYRMRAQVLLQLGNITKARELLVDFAMPLLNQHIEIFSAPPSNAQSEINWRALRLYVPWQLVNTIQQQVWTYHEQELSADYIDADVLLQDCISWAESQTELASALPLLYTLRTELMNHQCRVARNAEVRDIMSFTADGFLDDAAKLYSPLQDNADQRAYHLALQIAELERSWIDYLGENRLEQAPIVLSRIEKLQREAQAEPTPPFRVIAARLEWLKGIIEADREYCDPERFPRAFEAARAHLQRARDMLIEAKLTQVPIMLGILADLNRLEGREYQGPRDRGMW